MKQDKIITLQIKLPESDYKVLKAVKGSMTWQDFLFSCCIVDMEDRMVYKYENRKRNKKK